MSVSCLELSPIVPADGGLSAPQALPADHIDQAPARRALRAQVARLERELMEQRCSSWPRARREEPLPGDDDRRAGPALLSIGELEALRDELVTTLAQERRALSERLLAEERYRRLREELILDPAAHAGARVSNADVGESGCGEVRSEPEGGVLGMLMGWWRVVVSSGCP
jgi:hypothetical protein